MKKKMVSMLLCTGMVLSMLAGCSQAAKLSTVMAAGKETSSSTEELAEGNYKIGIAQFAQHGSLDNCREGFLQGLEEEGFVEGENLEIDYQNSDADMGTAGTIAQGFAAKGVDLMCGIATPAAQACYNAALKTEIPTIIRQ